MIRKIIWTKNFKKDLRKHRKDGQLLDALEKKIERLKEDPYSVGGYLSGQLHGYKSTRILGKYRLVFRIEDDLVYLVALDHRKFDYEGINLAG